MPKVHLNDYLLCGVFFVPVFFTSHRSYQYFVQLTNALDFGCTVKLG